VYFNFDYNFGKFKQVKLLFLILEVDVLFFNKEYIDLKELFWDFSEVLNIWDVDCFII